MMEQNNLLNTATTITTTTTTNTTITIPTIQTTKNLLINNDSGVEGCSTSGTTSGTSNINNKNINHNNSDATTSAIDLSEDENKSIQEQTSEIFELNDFRNTDLPKRLSNRLSTDSCSTYELIDVQTPESIDNCWNNTTTIKLNSNLDDEVSTTTVIKQCDLKCDNNNIDERDTFSPVNSEDNVPCYQLNENTLKLGDNFTVADVPEYEEDNNLFRRRKYDHLRSSTKEEKQRQNEEIVILESSSVSSETGSWESLFPNNTQGEIKDCCKLFLTNEIKFCSHNNDSCENSSKIEEDKNISSDTEEQNKPSCSVKACFIDASSLLDDTEVPYTNLGSRLPETGCSSERPELETIKINKIIEVKDVKVEEEDVVEEDDSDKDAWPKPKHIEKLDTFHTVFEKCKLKTSITDDEETQNDTGLSSDLESIDRCDLCDDDRNELTTKLRQEYEKKQGNMVFKNSIQQFSGHLISPKIPYSDDNYSDFSLPSIYSNESDSNNVCSGNDDTNDDNHFNRKNYKLLNTEQQDSTQIIFPDTPHNSIIQISTINQHNIKTTDIEMENLDIQVKHEKKNIIPKRIQKCDESSPIISGGASIKDFFIKPSDSPSMRRKNIESLPIISGGSLFVNYNDDIDDFKTKLIDKPKNTSSTIMSSWIVDMSDCSSKSSRQRSDSSSSSNETGHPSLERCSTKNGSLGYFVDFNEQINDHLAVTAVTTTTTTTTTTTKTTTTASTTTTNTIIVQNQNSVSLLQDNLKKSTGFYVDLSDNENSLTSTPSSKKSKTPPGQQQQQQQDKKNIFSMFIDFGDKKPVTRREPFSLTSKLSNSLQQKKTNGKTKELNDYCMSKSVSTVTSSDMSDNDQGSSPISLKKIEETQQINDYHPVIRRHLPKIETKRHSWNTTNNQDDLINEKIIPDIEREYKRSVSLSTEKGIMNILDKLPLISKTSSMSIDSSLSPFDDFSCTKSDISIYSNNSGPSVHSSLDCNLSKGYDINDKKRRRCDVKINETFDKSSQGSITDGIFSKDLSPISTTTETDDITFQNEINEIDEKPNEIIVEKINENITVNGNSNGNGIINGNCGHTMETLHATIEKQKQLLETVTENVETQSTNNIFVKLSDMDKPITKFELHSSTELMTNSAGSRVARLFHETKPFNVITTDRYSWNMSRSTGNPLVNLATSVENTRSLSRLFPHLSKDSADESSLSSRQPRRLGEDLLKMFLQEIATDVTLEVGNRKMRAHKCILRSRCQYFAAILAGGWVQNAGNIISLPGYSYGVVHFALCHIYSGAAHPPEGISLMELAGLADLLGLEGLKEVTSHALKTNYCHNFHKPCSGCIDGIVQVLPVSLNHGLDELYRKCLKWVCRHYVKVWPTRSFAQLSYDLIYRSRQQIVAHMNSENVLNTYLDCEHILSMVGPCKWAVNVEHVLRDMIENSLSYISDHFASLIASDSFLSLGHGNSWNISRLEHLLLRTASTLTPDQACKSYQRCTRLNTVLGAKVITLPNGNLIDNNNLEQQQQQQKGQHFNHHEEMDWNEEFIRLVSSIVSAVEQCLTRQCARAMKVNSWQRMDPELRKKIQKLACLSEPVIDRKSRTINKFSYNHPATAYQSRNHDLHQVRLAIQAHSRRSISTDNNKQYRASQHTQTNNVDRFLQSFQPTTDNKSVQANRENREKDNRLEKLQIQKTTSRAHVPEQLTKAKLLTHKRSQSEKIDIKSIKEKPLTNAIKLNDIKPRYLEPKKVRGVSGQRIQSTSNLQKGKRMSSSESSTRTSSPAGKKQQQLNKKITESNISLDSLTSPAKAAKNLRTSSTTTTTATTKNDEISIDSLGNSLKSSIKTDRTISHECLLQVNTKNNIATDNKVSSLQSKMISKSNPMINKENISGKPLIGGGNKLAKSKSISYQNTTGSSPSTVIVRGTNNLTFSPRDGYKGRIGTTKLNASDSSSTTVVKRSFLSAKSKEILLKKNQNIKTAIPIIKSNSASPVLGEKKLLNKSASVTNVPTIPTRKSLNAPTTLHLRRTAKVIPTTATTTTITKINPIKLNNKTTGTGTSQQNIVGCCAIELRRKEEISNEICVEFIVSTDEKFESKLERSSTFCKESSDIPTRELQIIE